MIDSCLASWFAETFEKPTGFKTENMPLSCIFVLSELKPWRKFRFSFQTVEEIPEIRFLSSNLSSFPAREKKIIEFHYLSLSLRRSSTPRTICSDEAIAIMVIVSLNIVGSYLRLCLKFNQQRDTIFSFLECELLRACKELATKILVASRNPRWLSP